MFRAADPVDGQIASKGPTLRPVEAATRHEVQQGRLAGARRAQYGRETTSPELACYSVEDFLPFTCGSEGISFTDLYVILKNFILLNGEYNRTNVKI